jgi:hypothetical protein
MPPGNGPGEGPRRSEPRLATTLAHPAPAPTLAASFFVTSPAHRALQKGLGKVAWWACSGDPEPSKQQRARLPSALP